MEVSNIMQLLLYGNQLKRTSRTGWAQRGVADAENVAAHSFGVAFTVITLAQTLETKINLERALVMAVLHDLPESITTDIPTTAWQYFPSGTKKGVEYTVMKQILGNSEYGEDLRIIWEEFQQGESIEASLVHDADKLEMYLQAWIYEREGGNRYLGEFWENAYEFSFPEVQAVFDGLLSLRNEE